MQEIPTIVEERYSEIVNIIENFCEEKLDNQYKVLATNICREIAREHTSINKGKASSWACGIVHALGLRNDLFSSKEQPSIKVGELYKAFGVSSSTGLSKSKEIRNLINIDEEKWSINIYGERNSDVLEEVALTSEKNESSKEEIEDLVKKAIGEVQEAIKDLENDLVMNIADKNIVEANKLIDKAWEQKNYNKKVKLAQDALQISGDCSEAYVILSYNQSISGQEQKNLVLKAIECARKIIGEENIDRYIGKFLDAEIAKPYFSAKYRLGSLLWSLGEREEAVEVYTELLRLSPEDNLMIRGTLLSWLIILNKHDEVGEILNKYNNDFLAAVKFSKALYYYKNNEYQVAERALKIAEVGNKHVIPYIVKQKKLPKSIPLLKKLGGEDEAMNYMKYGEDAWQETTGAIQWVKDFLKNRPF